jgi:cobalt-zinc-cadmium efflux system outer membrane protein
VNVPPSQSLTIQPQTSRPQNAPLTNLPMPQQPSQFVSSETNLAVPTSPTISNPQIRVANNNGREKTIQPVALRQQIATSKNLTQSETSNLRSYMPGQTSRIFEPRNNGYSITQLQQIALQTNPTVIKKQREIQSVYGQWMQAGLYANPSFTLNGADYADDGTLGKQGFMIEQEIIRGNKLALARNVERWSLEIAKKEWEITQRKVENDVKALAYDLVFSGNLVTAYRELAEIADESVRISEMLVSANEIAKSDLLQHRILRNRTIVELSKAEQDEQKKWEELAALIGQPNLIKQPITDNLRDANQNIAYETAWQRLLTESPELQAENFRKQKANCVIAREKAENISNVTVSAGAAYHVNDKRTLADVGVSIPLRVHDRNQGNIRKAQADSMVQSSEIERLQLELRTRFLKEWNEYEKSLKIIRQYESTILPDARESVDLVIKGAKQGETSSLEQLIAQQTYIQTIIEYLNSWRDMAISGTYIDGLLLKGGLDGNY